MALGHGDYENPALFSNEELVSLSRAGDADATSALVTRMIPLVRGKASSIHDSEMGSDDLFQEGMVGLLSAIGSFDSTRDASFKTYAGVCIANRITSAVRKFHGKKRYRQVFVFLSKMRISLSRMFLQTPKSLCSGMKPPKRFIPPLINSFRASRKTFSGFILMGAAMKKQLCI